MRQYAYLLQRERHEDAALSFLRIDISCLNSRVTEVHIPPIGGRPHPPSAKKTRIAPQKPVSPCQMFSDDDLACDRLLRMQDSGRAVRGVVWRCGTQEDLLSDREDQKRKAEEQQDGGYRLREEGRGFFHSSGRLRREREGCGEEAMRRSSK